jgi:ankyrin repeat protein
MLTKRSTIPSLSVPDFFHQYTDEENDSYDAEVTKAVRALDLTELKALHKKGRTFQCGNRFGESLLHMACRRGSIEVVQFFLDCNVSINCVDDMGRTPLHDAMWNSMAQVELVDLIVSKSPDLLFMSDIRGHIPLEYCRREHWLIWNKYLESRKETICKASAIEPGTLQMPLSKTLHQM